MSNYQPTPTTFREAAEILESGRTRDSRSCRKIANNTTLETRGPDTIAVRLHGTDVFTFHRSGAVSLDSGGWQTVTTKERINRYLAPGLSLYQDAHVWYVQDRRPEFLLAADTYAGGNTDRPSAAWHKRYRVEYSDGLLIVPDASLHGADREGVNRHKVA